MLHILHKYIENGKWKTQTLLILSKGLLFIQVKNKLNKMYERLFLLQEKKI